MPQITVSEEVYDRLALFQQVRQAVLGDGEGGSVDELAEMLLTYGIQSSLTALWEPQDKEVLVKTLRHLATRDPADVYGLVAEVLNVGAAVMEEERQEAERHFGFGRARAPAS
jgi:hypothetical protein